ncbi:MAG: hypothetical protein ACK4K7_15620 [Allosphingosinicella sp.]|uniref:hypothetical protein n=1 Tax=Allosphingosinicella sp. TaxID=2823234 RepID=UPI00393CFD93
MLYDPYGRMRALFSHVTGIKREFVYDGDVQIIEGAGNSVARGYVYGPGWTSRSSGTKAPARPTGAGCMPITRDP